MLAEQYVHQGFLKFRLHVTLPISVAKSCDAGRDLHQARMNVRAVGRGLLIAVTRDGDRRGGGVE